MKYFYDTEFLDDGSTIELISIGIIAGDGREYYAVNADCDFKRVREDDWLWQNVVPHLPTTKRNWDDPAFGRGVAELDRKAACVKPKWVIANEVREFIYNGWDPGNDDMPVPELWAYYGAYDHVVLAQLWGPMISLPKGIPMWTHELMQLFESSLTLKPAQDGTEHNALDDARWNLRLYRACIDGNT